MKIRWRSLIKGRWPKGSISKAKGFTFEIESKTRTGMTWMRYISWKEKMREWRERMITRVGTSLKRTRGANFYGVGVRMKIIKISKTS